MVQTHGMIDSSDKLLAAPLDALITRPALHRAASVFYLTERERADLISVAGPEMKLSKLINGVPLLPAKVPSEKLEVLFLARLHPRKRPDLFVEMAEIVVAEHDSVNFAIVGPDAGAGDAVASRTGPRIRWEGRALLGIPPNACGRPVSTCCLRSTSRTRCPYSKPWQWGCQ